MEADASDEIMEEPDLRQEDAFDYDGIALDIGAGGAEPQDEWDPINFY